MKKFSLVITIAFCTSLLLSSCSRLGNITISKRHYRSGYYVDLGSSAKQEMKPHSSSKPVTVEATPSATGTVSDNRSIADNVTITPEKETPQTAPAVATAHMEKKKHARKDATGSVYASTQNISSVREEAKAEDLNNQILSLPDPAPAGGSSSSGGVPFWLMIVFCVLIPPLAVGLTFGIVDKFWISLLLTLLFWIPGVIYALIVVTQK